MKLRFGPLMKRGAVTVERVIVLVAVVSTFLGPIPSADSSSGAQLCQVISVDSSAWLMKRDSTVKSTLTPGDILSEGDRVEVMRGNSAEIAFDKDRLNVVHVDGGTAFQITRLYPTSIELTKGNLFALLDNKISDRRFKLMTPTAVASVRGTQFQVNFADATGSSQISTYEGLVQVSGRDPKTGYEAKEYILVGAHQKAMVDAQGKTPAKSEPMQDSEMSEISRIKRMVSDAKSRLTASPLPEGPSAASSPRSSGALVSNHDSSGASGSSGEPSYGKVNKSEKSGKTGTKYLI